MSRSVIVSAVRTPFGKLNGGLAGYRATELGAIAIRSALERAGLEGSEVDYAIMQKRAKGNKFAIVTLRYTDASPVPGLLMPYIYKDIANDLDGFHALLRALPIELGPSRWKADVV